MGSIKGFVRDGSDYPLEGVSCMIVDGPNHLDIAAFTDINGIFSFGDLHPGDYKIQVYKDSEGDVIPVRVFENKKAIVRIYIETDSSNNDINEIDEIM